ncbi:MAG TPA: TolC family protein [Pseudomonadaceae bacterium]|nr:TolC family protein [Pseudomonadaceae bacterium]
MKVLRLLCLFLVASLAGQAAATPLTMKEAWHSALQQNRGLQSQEFIYLAEKEGVREAWGQLLPQIQATAGYGWSDYVRDFDLQSSVSDSDTHNRYDISLDQVVYSRKAFKNIGRAKAAEVLADEQLQEFRINIGYLALEAYLEAAQLQAEALVVEKEIANHEKRLQQLDSMRERGFASRADSLEAQATIDQVRAELSAIQSQYRAALKHLESVTGLPLQQRQLKRAPVQAWQHTPALLQRDWATLALGSSHAIQRARSELGLAEATHSVEQGSRWPEVFISARYNENDTFATTLREETRVELQLRLPLYSGGSTSARIRGAEQRVHAGRYQVMDTENAILVEVARISEELGGSHGRISALLVAQESSRAALEAAERGFVGGVRSLNELLDSRNRLSRVERDLSNEIHNNLIRQFQLRKMAGVLTEEDIDRLFATQPDELGAASS